MSTEVEAVGRSKTTRSRAGARVSLLNFVHKHPLFSIALIAGVIRFISTFIAAKYFSGSYVFDDGTYMMMAEAKVNGSDSVWDPYTEELYLRTSTFMVPLTLLFEAFGPVKLLGQMFIAVVGTATAVVTTRIALSLFRPWIAVAVGLVVALLPSQVLWSALIMKDAWSWLLLASAALLVLFFNRAEGRWLLGWCVGVVGVLILLGFVRQHTFLVATWSLAIAALFSARGARMIRFGPAVVVAAVLPFLLGYGWAGYDFVTNIGSLEVERMQNALGANTAIVDPEEPGAIKVSQKNVSGRSGKEGVGIDGWAIRTVPQEPTQEVPDAVPDLRDEGTLSPDLAHLPRGLSVTLLEPYPWQSATSQSFRYASMESVIWYPIVLVALIGLIGAFRNLVAMAYPLAVGGGLIIVMALTEGNVGTAFRHRSEVVWVIALLFGFGLTAIHRRLQRRHGAGAG